jgi:squalene-associated FAD-dependent desaturase
MTTGRVVVIGGGLAGLAAAVRLASVGVLVTLLEGRPRLGGATHSFERTGLPVDNGQHVFLRCYTEYLDFLRRIGSIDRVAIQTRFAVPVIRPGSTRVLKLSRARGLPAPLHLAPSLINYRVMPFLDRIKVIRAALRLRALDPGDDSLDERTFANWLTDQCQTQASIDALWNLLSVAALNACSDAASLRLATTVFQTALLSNRSAADIGFPLVPLRDLHGKPAQDTLRNLGAHVRLSTRVNEIQQSSGGFEVREKGGELVADVVIVATPHQQAAKLLPTGAVPDAGAMRALGAAPIVNAHVILDRAVAELPFAAVLGSPLQWIFDRTEIAGLTEGQYLAVSLSAAERYIDEPVESLRVALVPELCRVFPRLHEARVLDFFVTRERRATFLQAPGSQSLRPAVETRIPGLLLAGAWTDTGWPDTMEGAVRSGYNAAAAATRYLNRDHAAPGIGVEFGG